MEQLAHFVTKSFEYNNNRVMDVINMTQSTRSMLCGDPFRSVASVDRISTKSANRGADDDASSGLEDEENTMDIDITDFSSDDDEIRDAGKTSSRADIDSDNRIRDNTELGITSTLLRLSAANFRNAMGRLDKVSGEAKGLFGKTIPLADSSPVDTTQQIVKKKYATKNWLISDSPKRSLDNGKWAMKTTMNMKIKNIMF